MHVRFCLFVCFCSVFRSLAIAICNSVLSTLQRMVDFRFLPVCEGMLSGLRLFETSWTVATRLLCPWDSPGKKTEWVAISSFRILPDPGIKPASPARAGRLFTTGPHGKPQDRGGIQKLSLTGPTFSLWLLKKRSFHILRHRESHSGSYMG